MLFPSSVRLAVESLGFAWLRQLRDCDLLMMCPGATVGHGTRQPDWAVRPRPRRQTKGKSNARYLSGCLLVSCGILLNSYFGISEEIQDCNSVLQHRIIRHFLSKRSIITSFYFCVFCIGKYCSRGKLFRSGVTMVGDCDVSFTRTC